MIQESSATKTNHYVWGLDLSQTLQGAGGVAGLLSIVHGSSSTTAFYCFDGNGSVMQLVDVSNGTVLARYVYGPFGNIKNSEGTLVTDNPYRFSTKYTDFETELVYYGYRYYDPDQGRWINRDPIGNEINIGLYLFVDNSATSSIDAFGLYTINNAWNSLINEGVMPAISGYYDPLSGMYVPASYSDQQLFDRWVELESNDANWLTQIPDCPDRICVADEEPVDCTNGDWKSLGAADQTFHPEAKWCMRSDTSSGPGQQCCYDEKGKLRKSGLAAGTPDRQAASFWNGVFLNHYFHDVKPFNIAWDLDGGNGDLGANLQAYLDVRPPSQGGGSCYQ